MIATIFRQQPATPRLRAAAWRQLSDILAQRGGQLSESDVRKSLHALAWLRPQVPDAVRRDTAEALAEFCRFAPLVALYAADQPAVAAPMLHAVQLDDAEWLALLPSTTTAARNVLAARADLSPAVRRALGSLGTAVPALPSAPPSDDVGPLATIAALAAAEALPVEEEADRPSAAANQIRELVRRIDNYRARGKDLPKPQPSANFLFEAGPDGIVRWADGIARGAVVGISLAEPAVGGEPGVDGSAVGAFRRRAEIISARLQLGGDGPFGGEWRVSALPWFDGPTGQFRGYRGNVRRPRRNEIAYGAPVPSTGGDAVRQLIHELRSPLNAISGFGQIIAGQMFGPVNQRYRNLANTIVDDAAILQSIIEDLDSSARGVVPVDPQTSQQIDLNMLLASVESELAPLVIERTITWSLSRVGSDFSARVPQDTVRRMIGRLLTSVVDITENGETVIAQLIGANGDDRVQLRLVRPRSIRHSSAAELLDPGYNPRGDAPGAALLSLGFSLRLVDSLARGCGGALHIGANAVTLRLPAGHVMAAGGAHGA